MRRINTPNRANNLFGAGKHGFKGGTPGTSDRPTELEAAWANSIQEEIANAVEASGQALDPERNDQLLQAMQQVTVDPGRGANPTSLDIFVRQSKAVAENYDTVQDALNSGAKIVKLTEPDYPLAASWSIPEGVTLEGDGKANTSLTCSANITPIRMINVNDAGLEGVLIVAHATQTAPLVLLDANGSTMARCRVRDVQGSGSATDFPFLSVLARGGAVGSWAHTIKDVSVSGCGTLFKGETNAAGAWINSIGVHKVHANDFIRGMHLIATAGDGVSDCTFLDWATQTSARTQFGALLTDVGVQGVNRKNSFTDVRFYDLVAGALAYYIGDNVLDTAINGLTVDDPTPARILDKGINTRINGMTLLEYLTRRGREARLPTNAGLTQDVTGTGSTQSLPAYALLRTGATANSTARLYSSQLAGLAQAHPFSVDFGRPLRLSTMLSRIGAGAAAVGRLQLKAANTDGALIGAGLGVQVSNYDLYGETFGTSGQFVNLGTALTDSQSYKVEVIYYPGARVEWWVNGVLKAFDTTASKLPTGVVQCVLHTSLTNGVGANDVQLAFTPVEVRTAL